MTEYLLCSLCGDELPLYEKTSMTVFCWKCLETKPISKVDRFMFDLVERRNGDLFYNYPEESLQLIKKALEVYYSSNKE